MSSLLPLQNIQIAYTLEADWSSAPLHCFRTPIRFELVGTYTYLPKPRVLPIRHSAPSLLLLHLPYPLWRVPDVGHVVSKWDLL